MTTQEILERAKAVKTEAASYTAAQKNDALMKIGTRIRESGDKILRANAADLDAATSVSDVMKDRLRLTDGRIWQMCKSFEEIIPLDDPNGKVISSWKRGPLTISKVEVPIGVITLIYESRPSVTADAAALCIKSGNACVLRCGKEAHRTCAAICEAIKEGLNDAGLSPDTVNLIDDTSRESSTYLMQAVGYVDLLIPRGGAGLIRSCVENAKVPCIQTGSGICHVYVDAAADLDKAVKIVENAKCSRPSVCNAEDVCLVNGKIADAFLPALWQRLVKDRPENRVRLKLCDRSYRILEGRENCEKAGPDDFDTEFLDYILAVKIVGDVNEACDHIRAHSTGHSDAIVTEDREAADIFSKTVDSSSVYVNVSTRFTDGYEFGFGCEMGISTQKLHARGPMGLDEIMSYKYIVTGDGIIRN